MPKSPKKPEELTYEQAMAELDEITAALEGESRPLDEMLALNERAQALVKHCAGLLDAAELKVKQLNGDSLSDFDGES